MSDPAAAVPRFTLLGPVRAWRGGEQVALGRPQQQVVLAALLLNPGRPVGLDTLLRAVWGEDLPSAAVSTLRGYVSRLRRALDPGAAAEGDGGGPEGTRPATGLLEWTAGGYTLRIPADRTDVGLLDAELRAAAGARTGGRPEFAEACLERALALPQGPPLAGLPGAYAERQRERLAAVLLDAEQQRAEIGLELGRHEHLVAGLERLVGQHPLRERLRELLMLALYRSGRQAEAVEVYQDVRRRLDQELGLAPGPDLRTLHTRILRADPALRREAAAPAVSVPPPVPAPAAVPEQDRPVARLLPRALGGYVDRVREREWLDGLCTDPLNPADPAAPVAPAGPAVPARLAVLAGAAGSGKTTLAVCWAHRVADRFPDGQLYADLRGFAAEGPADPGEVLLALLRALGTPDDRIPEGQGARAALYRDRLATRRLLVILDNARRPEDVTPFLPETGPALTLVCSRDELPELIVREEAAHCSVGTFTNAAAHRLLRLRLGDARALADPHASRRLVELCDRLPLALSLALARLVARPTWSVADLVEELEDERARLAALDGPGRFGVERELGLSRRQLPEPAARLLPLLAVVPGAETDGYVAAALLDRPYPVGRAALADLAGLHLATESAPGRYQFHDLVRLYCHRLADTELDAPARAAAEIRLCEYQLAATAAAVALVRPQHRPHLPPAAPAGGVPRFPAPAAALTWFRREEPTLRALVSLAADGPRLPYGCRLVENAGFLYVDTGLFHAWEQAAARALAGAEACGAAEQWPHLYSNHSLSLAWQGRFDEALRQSERAWRLADPASEATLRHRFRALRSSVLAERGQAPEEVTADLVDMVAAARELADPRLLAQSLNNLADHRSELGDPAGGLAPIEEAVGLLADRPGDPFLILCTKTYAQVLHALGRTDEALTQMRRVLALGREHGNVHAEFDYAEFVGQILHDRGERRGAREQWERALELAIEQGRPTERLRARLAGV
ncbi:BTAD domain-containing putative transcriptional regulator [Kitasatospora sp. NPDC094015]|uniref:AfsR/SARP family transcriptional regulator n=1 Tax=Kitasatospora sp. NPDC094015 TaxID=3155205 RepID=UPI003326803F